MNPNRVVVAISEDRQWLVALSPNGRWLVTEWGEEVEVDYECYCGEGWTMPYNTTPVEDTGQGADEVLRGFLEGRDG